MSGSGRVTQVEQLCWYPQRSHSIALSGHSVPLSTAALTELFPGLLRQAMEELSAEKRTATALYLPPNLSFPLTVVRIHVRVGQKVRRGGRLFEYEYKEQVRQERDSDEEEEDLPTHGSGAPKWTQIKRRAHFETAIEGSVEAIKVERGQAITSPRQPIFEILEPCTHEIQFGGLCAICGKDLTGNDYIGFSDTSRATISMSHDNFGLTVSQGEAQRLEAETTRRLQQKGKLSLIVDLDQTIIHATTDPTVSEWKQDPQNPNWSALQDVEDFGLWSPLTGRDEMYYIKPRPYLREFLSKMSTLYEMHIYTMGTRNYANAVAKIIDPDGALFGQRILSRDESGSMNQKTLSRLFPVDTSMVVIIDDRGDVWDWSPNLVKVVPYTFFVGTGDLNSSFLPPLDPTGIVNAPGQAEVAAPSSSAAPASPAAFSNLSDPEALIPAVPISESATSVDNEQILAQSAKVAKQQSERPLAKAQQALDDRVREEKAQQPSSGVDDVKSTKSSEGDATGQEDESPLLQGVETETAAALSLEAILTDSKDSVAVLHDDDEELRRLEALLQEVHVRFYSMNEGDQKRDAKSIIPALKERVLQGCTLAFSSVIPLDNDPEQSEVWILARQFGARCQRELDKRTTTHLVARKTGTSKVMEAAKIPKIHIVQLAWLLNSIAHWKREREADYLLPNSDFAAPKSTHSSSDDEDHHVLPTLPILDETGTKVVQNENDMESTEVKSEDSSEESLEDIGQLPEIDWSATFDKIDDNLDSGDESDANAFESPSSQKKRLRTSTASTNTTDTSSLGESPLAKRVKMSKSRSSRLRQATGPGDIAGEQDAAAGTASPAVPLPNSHSQAATKSTSSAVPTRNGTPAVLTPSSQTGSAADEDDLDTFAADLEAEML